MNDQFEFDRRQMVEDQILGRGLRDPRLLAVFESVPRHLFVPQEDRYLAYADGPLSIGFDQTISQPYIVALMTSLLHLEGDERVLEVGTGSGYQAAILARMAEEVHTVELLPELAARAKGLLSEYPNVFCHVGDGSLGWQESAPYDGIIVTAAAPETPQALLDQLKDGGRLVIPVGRRGYQKLELWTRQGNQFDRDALIEVAFVPLRGKHGW
ncbi:MAG: protein-L-isoaspartate(D-aspartate) O-methyltransferase [Chloroflexi bacterium]|nr:protein-L-isoaspartate(D-aspartate) O-methyltransferase [Chloroflexota bacterium]